MMLTTQGSPISSMAALNSSSVSATIRLLASSAKAADSLAVHGQHHGGETGSFQLSQNAGGDGLDFGHDQVGLFIDHMPQSGSVQHGNDVSPIGYRREHPGRHRGQWTP